MGLDIVCLSIGKKVNYAVTMLYFLFLFCMYALYELYPISFITRRTKARWELLFVDCVRIYLYVYTYLYV